MKCCKAAHVILDFGVNGLATCQTRVVLGRIFPVFYGRADKMGGLRISSIGPVRAAGHDGRRPPASAGNGKTVKRKTVKPKNGKTVKRFTVLLFSRFEPAQSEADPRRRIWIWPAGRGAQRIQCRQGSHILKSGARLELWGLTGSDSKPGGHRSQCSIGLPSWFVP